MVLIFTLCYVYLGREEGQLWYPRKVAVIRHSGKYVVCDRGNERSRMQIFTKNGHFIKKIAIRYIDIVAGLAVTAQGNGCVFVGVGGGVYLNLLMLECTWYWLTELLVIIFRSYCSCGQCVSYGFCDCWDRWSYQMVWLQWLYERAFRYCY